jgi:hypothetical protein
LYNRTIDWQLVAQRRPRWPHLSDTEHRHAATELVGLPLLVKREHFAMFLLAHGGTLRDLLSFT